MIPLANADVSGPAITHPNRGLREAAAELEATFLSAMLKAAGLGEVRNEFSGGSGEAQFASFLRDEQARAIVAAGGIGLAESLYNALRENHS